MRLTWTLPWAAWAGLVLGCGDPLTVDPPDDPTEEMPEEPDPEPEPEPEPLPPEPGIADSVKIVPLDSVGNAAAIFNATITVPGATEFGAPGFHDAYRVEATLPDTLGATDGLTLVVSLRDLTRPDMTCQGDHPLSGCVTIDWDDFDGRPKVPAGGIFLNRLRITAADTADFFLRRELTLDLSPEPGPPT